MKEFFKKIWEAIKNFAVNKVWPWLKKNWMQIVNFLVIFVAYSKVYEQPGFGGVELILGLWLFILIAYYLFWKLFGLGKMFAPQPEPPKDPIKPVVEPVKPIKPKPEVPVTAAKPKGRKKVTS